MTILKSEILAHLNKELDRTETDIDECILETLKDLSLQDNFLWVEATVPTVIGKAHYSEPLDFKSLLTIKTGDNRPLGKLLWAEYQIMIRGQTSNDYGEPDRFTRHGGYWYAYPTPDAVYTMKLFYCAYILESENSIKVVNDIRFKDIYRDAIYAKTKAVYCRSLGWTDRQVEFELEYDKILLPPLKALVDHKPVFVTYHDL